MRARAILATFSIGTVLTGAGTAACSGDSPAGEECGNGRIDTIETRTASYREPCDDGNLDDGDGCSSTCVIESGWRCDSPGQSCKPRCGDGRVIADEVCEPGLPVAEAYCSACQELVPGTCGDGVVLDEFEQCDDSNLDPLDGCNEHCEIEFGFTCDGAPSTCAASGVQRDAVLEMLTDSQALEVCDWLVTTFGRPGASHDCTAFGSPGAFRLGISTATDCASQLASGYLGGCGSEATSGCDVGDLEDYLAAFGSSGSACRAWLGPWSCGSRLFFRAVAFCDQDEGAYCESAVCP